MLLPLSPVDIRFNSARSVRLNTDVLPMSYFKVSGSMFYTCKIPLSYSFSSSGPVSSTDRINFDPFIDSFLSFLDFLSVAF